MKIQSFKRLAVLAINVLLVFVAMSCGPGRHADRVTAPQIGLTGTEVNSDLRRALQWRVWGLAIDRKRFLQARKLRPYTAIGKARDANLEGDYKGGAAYACAVLSRPLLSSMQRYSALIDAYYALKRLRRKAGVVQALRQFDEIGAVPQDMWRACYASEMHDTKVLLGDARPEDPIRYPMPPPYAPPAGDGFWQTEDPKKMGWKTPALNALRDHLTLCRQSGADGCLVVYKNKIVSEWQSPRYFYPMFAMSSTKSWTSLLVGMLIADGKIRNVDEPVGKYLPTWRRGKRGKVTLRHLLNMTSGLARLTSDKELEKFTDDYNAYVLAMTPKYEPGTTWEYSNQGVQLLSPILDRAAGRPIQDYARERLFVPLGMQETHLHQTRQGNAVTFADGMTTCRDMARLGLLMMHKGKWQGKQIVPAAWCKASLQPCPQDANYGFLWWLFPETKSYAMLGYLNTDCYCFPDKDLLIVRMQTIPYLFPKVDYQPKAMELFRKMGR